MFNPTLLTARAMRFRQPSDGASLAQKEPWQQPGLFFAIEGEADYCPVWVLIVSSIWALTASRLNDAGACIGGYSTAVCANSTTCLCT